jgi:hypothetical protein
VGPKNLPNPFVLEVWSEFEVSIRLYCLDQSSTRIMGINYKESRIIGFLDQPTSPSPWEGLRSHIDEIRCKLTRRYSEVKIQAFSIKKKNWWNIWYISRSINLYPLVVLPPEDLWCGVVRAFVPITSNNLLYSDGKLSFFFLTNGTLNR